MTALRGPVRLRIQDQPARADVTFAGDGTAVSFPLAGRNISSGTAFVPSVNGWSATGAAFDASGFVSLSNRVSAGSAIRAVYVHSVFSDTEIDQMIVDGGGVLGASVQAVQTLLFDGVKRAKWAAPDGTQYDDTAALTHLRELFDLLRAERADVDAAAGGWVSWSLNQGEG